jgi:hypothetical protein
VPEDGSTEGAAVAARRLRRGGHDVSDVAQQSIRDVSATATGAEAVALVTSAEEELVQEHRGGARRGRRKSRRTG